MSVTTAMVRRITGGGFRSDGARRRPTAQLATLGLACPALLVTAGRLGAVIWVAVAITWYLLETPVAIGVGIVGLVAAPSYTFTLGLAIDDGIRIDPQLAWLAPLALFSLAVTDWEGTAHPKTAALATTVATAILLLASSLLLAGSTLPLWTVGLALLGLLAVGAVGIDRYERIVVAALEPGPGSVADSDATPETDSSPDTDSNADPESTAEPTAATENGNTDSSATGQQTGVPHETPPTPLRDRENP